MIKIPFSRNNFSDEFKGRLSGMNATLKYENVESDLAKVAVDMQNVLGNTTYKKIIKYYTTPNTEMKGSADAVDALQRAMLHFAIYHGIIFLTLQIGNDGITTKKTETETTAYKYQTDELKETLIKTAWFWMSVLYGILNEHPEAFSDWEDSGQNKSLKELPVGPADFEYWYGVKDNYFLIKVAPLIRRVYNDEIMPRMQEGVNNPVADEDPARAKLRADVDRDMRRAVVYKVMALACKTFAYFELPEPVRSDISNEVTASVLNRLNAERYIRDTVSKNIDAVAARYLVALEMSVALLNKNLNSTTGAAKVLKSVHQTEADKYVFI